MKSARSTLLFLALAWLLSVLGFRLDQMTREFATNYVLAKSLGASVEGWRMSLVTLTIHVRALSLPETHQTFFAIASSLTTLLSAVFCLLIEIRLRSFFGKSLSLYWAFGSLLAFLRPMLLSGFLRGHPWAGLWRGVSMNQVWRQTLAITLLLLALGMTVWIFRRLLALSAGQFPLKEFSGRIVAALSLICIPMNAALLLALSRFPYFRSREAWPYLLFTFTLLLAFSLLAAIKRVQASNKTPSLDRMDLLKTCTLSVFFLAAIPLSDQLGRWTHQNHLVSYSTQHFRISFPKSSISESAVALFAREAEQTFARVVEQLGPELSLLKINFLFFANVEEKLFRRGNGEVVDFDLAHDEVQLVFIPPFDRFNPSLIGDYLLQRKYGEGKNSILKLGLAGFLAENGDLGLESQAQGLLASILEVEGPLSLSDLLFSPNLDSISPYVNESLAQEFTRWIHQRYGLSKILALYAKSFTRTSVDNDVREVLSTSYLQLQSDWAEHCRQCQEELLSQHSKPRRRSSNTPIPFQKGISFSAEGGPRTGYLSEAARASLDQLQNLHAGWISIMPFAFASWDQTRPEISFSHRGSWESDDSLRKITWEARSRGIKVFLKPHLWLIDSSTTELKFTNSEPWHNWFAAYRRYILHQARLGEEIGAEIFSIGNELQHLTLDPAHEKDWRELISEVRKVFSGEVTYCANWGDDFEKIRFADALDAIGLNAYYPLVARLESSPEEWLAGARAVADKVEQIATQAHRPILITEIGYPSTVQAAVTPWSEEGSSQISLQAQAHAAQAFFFAFWEKPWLRGIYWWKWYSHGRGGGEGDPTYMPRGKPVADVIAQWYARPRK